MKKRIIGLGAVVLCVAFILLYRYQTRFQYNDSNTIGNTSGNLLNDGLFCEEGGKIYFSNPDDDGCLYVMDSDLSHVKKISPDTVSHINAAGDYIYYARHNNRKKGNLSNHLSATQEGVFRITSSGRHPKALSYNPADTVSLLGNYIYYQNYISDSGLSLYRCGINDTEAVPLSEDNINPLALTDSTLYYNGVRSDHKIHKMNLANKEDEVIFDVNCTNVILDREYLYFMNMGDNYSLCRVHTDGSNPATLVRERLATFNISRSGRYLYYQADCGTESYLGQYDSEKKETTLIKKGSFSNINVCSDYVFFQQYDNSDKQYYFKTNNPDSVKEFHPGKDS